MAEFSVILLEVDGDPIMITEHLCIYWIVLRDTEVNHPGLGSF